MFLLGINKQNGHLPQTLAARLGGFKGKESILVFWVIKWHKPALSGQCSEFRIISKEKENEQTGCYIKAASENPHIRLWFNVDQKQAVFEAI